MNDRYNHGAIECIEAIRSALSEEEFRGFCKGNVIKYIWREPYKGQNEDLLKARDYIDYALCRNIIDEIERDDETTFNDAVEKLLSPLIDWLKDNNAAE